MPTKRGHQSIPSIDRRRGGGRSRLAVLDSDKLYEKCGNRLTEEIRKGTFIAGKRLPSERLLADAMGFTRLTVRRALTSLAEQGLIERGQPRGWQVSVGPVSEPPNTLMSFTALAAARGLKASGRILNLAHRPATLEEADQLRIAPGNEVIDVERLRCMDGAPIAIERLVLAAGRVTLPQDFDFTTSLHAALESKGVIPARCDAVVDVIEATATDAELLGVPVGHGLLRLRCITSIAAGVPISLDWVRYHPERYQFRATLQRRRT